jgi:flagellar biogenesis protein FliO
MDAVPTSSALSGLPLALARLWTLVVGAARAVKIRRQERSLRVCETLSLGERRFLVVVQFGQQKFLIGSTSQSISLLHRLDECAVSSPGFEDSVPGNSFRNGTR